jgi:calpain-15
VILLEKAWAKVFGNYGNIISGDPREVIASITGGPTWCISSDEPTFIEKLKPIMNSDYIVCAGTYHENSDYEKVGLIANHAYSILNFRTIILPNK